MRLYMVNRVKGFVVQVGKGACGKGANEQAANKPRRIGNSNRVNVVPGKIGVAECLANDWVDYFNVATCGDLWYYTAIGCMNVDLGVDDITEQATAIFYNGGRSFVATAFDSQNFH